MKKTRKKWIAACLAGMCLAGSILSPAQSARAAVSAWSKSNGKYYNSAGKVVPNVVAKGMDVSFWQGMIDWDKVKASGQIEFAFIRVAHGGGMDLYCNRNLSEANRVGIPVGVYFYSTAKTVKQAQNDAQVTINAIRNYKISYPVVIDIEDPSQVSLTNARRTKMVQAFSDVVRAAGYQPMIYCNTYWANNYINMNGLQGVDSWIAEWAANPTASVVRDIWQVTDKGKVSGISGDVDLDFAYKRYVAGSTASEGKWVKSEEKYKYQNSDGTYVENKFQSIGGKMYYFDSSGFRVTGFYTVDGKTYYFGTAGVMKTGLRTIDGAKYYFDSTGARAESAWVTIGQSKYYAGADGKLKTGWLTLDGNKYYLDSSGVMKTGWAQIGEAKYYFEESGAMARQKWVDSNGSRYYMKKNGQMKKGWLDWNGNRYYLKTDGTMRIGWLKYKGKYYYFDNSGAMLRSTTVTIDGKTYKFNAKGVWKSTK